MISLTFENSVSDYTMAGLTKSTSEQERTAVKYVILKAMK